MDVGRVATFLLIGAATVLGVRYFTAHTAEEKVISRVEISLAQIKKDGAQKHPDLLPSEATQREAIEKSSASISNEASQAKRLQMAASNFMGFYLVNTRERPEFCRGQGVEIDGFVRVFAQSHSAEVARARLAVATSGTTEDELYALLKPQLRTVIAQDMADLAKTHQKTLKQSCELLVETAATLVPAMHIGKINPTVHQALLTGN